MAPNMLSFQSYDVLFIQQKFGILQIWNYVQYLLTDRKYKIWYIDGSCFLLDKFSLNFITLPLHSHYFNPPSIFKCYSLFQIYNQIEYIFYITFAYGYYRERDVFSNHELIFFLHRAVHRVICYRSWRILSVIIICFVIMN